jgi:tellurite resistance protein
VQQLADALSLDIAGVEKISLGISNQIGGYLDIGFEPDRRYGSSPLRRDGHVVLFKALGGGQVDGESPAFAAARAMVDVAALAAGADDKVDSGELDAITAEIRNVPELGKIERARLIAYASTLLKDTSLHRFALNKLKTLDAAAKQSVVKSATAAILADGYASPAEVKFLERLYKAMNLPADGVYAMLHRGAVVIDEPVAVAAEHRSSGLAIPRPPEAAPKPSSTIKIDHSRLERLRSETSAVSELLAGIFVEEDAVVTRPTVSAPVPSTQSRFTGLDTAHAELLMAVLKQGSLGRDEFDDKARTLRLLPDGAIERISDWGFDQFEEPIIEGDDELSIAPHILAELNEAEAA